MSTRALLRALVALFAVAAVVLAPRRSLAHTVGLSNGEVRLEGAVLSVSIGLAQGDALRLAPTLDTSNDRRLTQDELARANDVLAAAVLGGLATHDGTACAYDHVEATLVEADGVLVRGKITCASGPPTHLHPPFLTRLGGHRHLVRIVTAGAPRDVLLTAESPRATLGSVAKDGEPRAASFGTFVHLGVFHILTGIDHLVFLAGLLLVRGRLRDYVALATAFTVAHSVTLALAALHVVSLSPRVVEPAIALSIVYVGVESLVVQTAPKRPLLTFLFGLVHGFGFAGGLEELSLERTRIPPALVGFNLGVEAGQLVALSVMLPLVLVVTKRHTREPVRRALAAAVAVAGGAWLVARLVG